MERNKSLYCMDREQNGVYCTKGGQQEQQNGRKGGDGTRTGQEADNQAKENKGRGGGGLAVRDGFN